MIVKLKDFTKLGVGSTRVITHEGYLHAKAAVTKVGVQRYAASDLGAGGPDEIVNVFRSPETVFHAETIESLKLKPIVVLHPESDVTADNHSRLSVGTVTETVNGIDRERLGAEILITDGPTVKRVIDKDLSELSLGYDALVILDPGEYNGETYTYRFDGPMLINHLAIVPDGRCGDSVKILDEGTGMNKEQMVKALRDAGVSEKKIAVFDGSEAQFTALLAGIRDMDISALVPAIVAELKPAIEELIVGDDFKSMLAKEIAASMSGGGSTGQQEPVDAAKPEITPEMMDAAVRDRAALIAKTSEIVKVVDGFDAVTATRRELLEKSLRVVGFKDVDMVGRSDEYLEGTLDVVLKDRAEAGAFYRTSVTDNTWDVGPVITGLAARKLLRDER